MSDHTIATIVTVQKKATESHEKLTGEPSKVSEGEEKVTGEPGKVSEGEEKLTEEPGKVSGGEEKLTEEPREVSEGKEKLTGDVGKVSESHETVTGSQAKVDEPQGAEDNVSTDVEERGEFFSEELSEGREVEAEGERVGEEREGEEYGEGGPYLPFRFLGEGDEESLWEKKTEVGSITSEVIRAGIEETEEEKEARRERELLIEDVRQKILDRMVLRRKNSFLQKKLVEHFKKRRMENVFKEELRGIDLEKKYLMRLYAFQEFKHAQETEIEELTQKMEQYENETKLLEQELKEKIENMTARAKEISLNLILTKTGKKLSEKTVDRLLARQVKKNEEKGKKKLQYIKVKNLIEEKEAELRAMEYIAEGLNIVDCEQMKIDNQNFSDKIEEKEDELTKMRLKTEEMMQNLAQIREKSFAIDGDIELMEEKVYEVENQFVETRERLTRARKKRDFLREEYIRLKASSGLLTRDNLLEDFEGSIVLAKTLAKQLEKLRKLMQEKAKQEVELNKAVVTSRSNVDFSATPRGSKNFAKRSLSSKLHEYMN